jgi:hypothetical protein
MNAGEAAYAKKHETRGRQCQGLPKHTQQYRIVELLDGARKGS